MVRFRRGALLVVLGGLAAAGLHCSLLTSTDGLSGGPDPSLVTEGGGGPDVSISGNDGGEPGEDGAAIDGAAEGGCASLTPASMASDPKNCGACGHDCLGGACIGSLCQPVVLARDQGIIRGLAVVGDQVYWASRGNSGIHRVSVAGGPSTALVVDAGLNPSDLVVGPAGLVWLTASEGKVARASLDGGGVQVLVPARDGGFTGRVAVTGSTVYFTNFTDLTVERVELDGGGRAVVEDLQPEAYGLALGGGAVFWTTSTGTDAGTLMAAGPGNQAPRLLAGGLRRPRTLKLVGPALLWTHWIPGDGGAIVRADLAGDAAADAAPALRGSTTVVAGGLNSPWDVDMDESGVYWTTTAVGGGVYTCPTTGCTSQGPRTLASGLSQPTYLALDARAVYVATNDGAVVKVAK